jgi:predicted nucleotidyltransferase component of viral defense system
MSQADSIKARIRNLATKEKKPFDYLLMHYFIERLLYRISLSAYADDFILKGGLLLYTIFTGGARATKDIDFLARRITNTPEEIKRIFMEICEISADDAVLYDADSVTVERIKEDADYEGVRVKLTGFLDKSRHVLQFDIGFGDVVVPKPVTMEYPSLLDMERPIIKAYSKESVIAEKFEAMIYLSEANSRMKDFYDIYTLCKSFDFEGRVLYEAISKTFQIRGTPLTKSPTVFSNSFAELSNKQTQWKAFQKRIHVAIDIDFSDIINTIKEFLLPTYDCILREDEFFGNWNHNETIWEMAL